MKTNGVPDNLLIERVQRGDQWALDELVARHQSRAYQYAYRLTRDSDEAADIVANAFLRICRSIDKFKGESAFSTWLYRIVTNCYYDIKKKDTLHPTLSLDAGVLTEDGESIELSIPDAGPTALDESIRLERNRVVQNALVNLPDYQKSVLVMFHVEMLSYEEISETLGLPIGTVKSRLNRARNSLAHEMSSYRSLFQEEEIQELVA